MGAKNTILIQITMKKRYIFVYLKYFVAQRNIPRQQFKYHFGDNGGDI